MTTRHLVDPELLPFLDSIPTMELSLASLPTLRQLILDFYPSADVSSSSLVCLERHVVPPTALAATVSVVVYRPVTVTSPAPAILHIHGGGFVFGSPRSQASKHLDMVAQIACVIVSVDYRLAPETPHPGPVEDCYAALKWLHDNAAALGVDRDRIAVSGESAGGGLAAALTLLVRDRGEMNLIFQHLVYPMLDDRTGVLPSANPHVGEFIWTPSQNVFGWSSLLGIAAGKDDVSPYAAPVRARDLSRLPPAYISVGALDLFLEENIEYARRLLRAGVEVEFHVYPGAYHGFDVVPGAAVAIRAERDSRNSLSRALKLS